MSLPFISLTASVATTHCDLTKAETLNKTVSLGGGSLFLLMFCTTSSTFTIPQCVSSSYFVSLSHPGTRREGQEETRVHLFLFASEMRVQPRLMAFRGNLQTGRGSTDRWAVEEQRAAAASPQVARQKLLTSRSIDAVLLKGSRPRWFFKRREEDSTHPTYALTDTPSPRLSPPPLEDGGVAERTEGTARSW